MQYFQMYIFTYNKLKYMHTYICNTTTNLFDERMQYNSLQLRQTYIAFYLMYYLLFVYLFVVCIHMYV